MVKLNRKKILITTAVLAGVVFALLIGAEKKIANSTPKKQIYVAVRNINQGEFLKASDFKIEDKDLGEATPDMMTSLGNIKNEYAAENIYKEEPINKNIIANKNDSSKMFLKPGEREFSIPLTKLDNDAFAGTLRRGDIVDISHTGVATQGDPTAKTELTGKRVRVLGAVDSQGRFLEPNDKNVLAAAIMFAGTEDAFVKTSNEMYSGSFKIAKCPAYKESVDNN